MPTLRLFFRVFSVSFILVVIVFAALPISASANTPSSSSAYTLNDKYWPSNYDIQYIKSSMTGKDSAGFSNAINAWNASAAPIYFVPRSNGNYVDLFDQNDGNSGTDGYSYEYTGSFGCNVQGITAYIITGAGAYVNTYYTNQSYYSNGAVQSVAAHELGHVVGLGHDPNENQLMYYSTNRWFNDGIDTPQSDEIAGTNALYNAC